jgi:hypothetical protein
MIGKMKKIEDNLVIVGKMSAISDKLTKKDVELTK